MAAARAAAEAQDYERAAWILESRRLALESHALLSSDRRTQALVAELRGMQERTLTAQRYNESGRAYMLSGLSSHSFQRATARADPDGADGPRPQLPDAVHDRHGAPLPDAPAGSRRGAESVPDDRAVAQRAAARRAAECPAVVHCGQTLHRAVVVTQV
jgi:hypothetical protein